MGEAERPRLERTWPPPSRRERRQAEIACLTSKLEQFTATSWTSDPHRNRESVLAVSLPGIEMRLTTALIDP